MLPNRSRSSSMGSAAQRASISALTTSPPRVSQSLSARVLAGLVSLTASSVATETATSCHASRWPMSCRPDHPWAPSNATLNCSSERSARASNGRNASRSSSRNSSASRYIRRRSHRDRLAVLSEDLAEDRALFAEGHVGRGAADEVRHQVRLARGGTRSRISEAAKRGLDFRRIALAPGPREPSEVAFLGPGWHGKDRDAGLLGLVGVGVDPDDAPLPGVELTLESIGGVGDLVLRIALGDGGDHPAAPVDLVQIPQHLAFRLVGQRLDEPGPTEGIDRRVDPALLGDDLLLAKREHGGLRGRHGKRLV